MSPSVLAKAPSVEHGHEPASLPPWPQTHRAQLDFSFSLCGTPEMSPVSPHPSSAPRSTLVGAPRLNPDLHVVDQSVRMANHLSSNPYASLSLDRPPLSYDPTGRISEPSCTAYGSRHIERHWSETGTKGQYYMVRELDTGTLDNPMGVEPGQAGLAGYHRTKGRPTSVHHGLPRLYGIAGEEAPDWSMPARRGPSGGAAGTEQRARERSLRRVIAAGAMFTAKQRARGTGPSCSTRKPPRLRFPCVAPLGGVVFFRCSAAC